MDPAPLHSRHEFSKPVKEQLAARVAFRCSNPGCRAATVGPSNDRRSGLSKSGEAAHISAAAPNGPRYEKMSRAERVSPSNGIWLCNIHATLIDAEPTRYPTSLLRSWKARGEELARLEQLREIDPIDLGLIPHEMPLASLHNRTWRGVVAAFLRDVGGSQLWDASQFEAVRIVVAELVDNAVEHQAATAVVLRSGHRHVSLIYTSESDFGLADLRGIEKPGGGVEAVRILESRFEGRLALGYRAGAASTAIWTVTGLQLGRSDDPCTINLSESTPEEVTRFAEDAGPCDVIHVHGTFHDTFSDNRRTVTFLESLADDRVVVVHTAPGLLAEHIHAQVKPLVDQGRPIQVVEHV